MSDDQHEDPTDPGTLPPPGGGDVTPAEAATAPTPAEEPATAQEAVTAETTEATTTAAVATAPAEPARRSGVTVPVWVLVTLGAALVFLVGGLVGYAIGDDRDSDRESTATRFVGPGQLGRNGQGGTGPQGGLAPFGPFGDDRGGNGNGNGDSGGGNGNGGPSVPSVPNANGVFLGVAVQTSSDPAGAELMRVVADSPAADAGLRAGDVVTAVDGESVTTAAALTTAIRSHDVGDEVELTYTRDGASKTVTVTLGDRTPTSTQ